MTTNLYAPPKAEVALANETDHDRFIRAEAASILRPGEVVRWTAYVQKAPPLWVQMLFNGGIMLMLIKHYLVAVTNERIILMRTSNWWMKPKLQNKGTEEIVWADVTSVTTSGLLANRSATFMFKDGTKRTLRIFPGVKYVSGQKDFYEFLQNFDHAKLAA